MPGWWRSSHDPNGSLVTVVSPTQLDGGRPARRLRGRGGPTRARPDPRARRPRPPLGRMGPASWTRATTTNPRGRREDGPMTNRTKAQGGPGRRRAASAIRSRGAGPARRGRLLDSLFAPGCPRVRLDAADPDLARPGRRQRDRHAGPGHRPDRVPPRVAGPPRGRLPRPFAPLANALALPPSVRASTRRSPPASSASRGACSASSSSWSSGPWCSRSLSRRSSRAGPGRARPTASGRSSSGRFP